MRDKGAFKDRMGRDPVIEAGSRVGEDNGRSHHCPCPRKPERQRGSVGVWVGDGVDVWEAGDAGSQAVTIWCFCSSSPFTAGEVPSSLGQGKCEQQVQPDWLVSK